MADVVVVEGEDGHYHGFGLLKEGMRTMRKANVQSSRDQWEEWESHAKVKEARACSAKPKSPLPNASPGRLARPGGLLYQTNQPIQAGDFQAMSL